MNHSEQNQLSVAVVSAGSSGASSTKLLADRAAAMAASFAESRGRAVEIIDVDLRSLAGDVMPALTTGLQSEQFTNAVKALDRADGVIASTPVYNAGANGVFTSFFQAIDDDLMIAKPVILAATAASARHALVVDNQLRPMFAYLRALTVPTSLFAASEDWNDSELGSRIERAATEFVLLMESDFTRQVRELSWGRYRHEFDSLTGPAEVDFDSDMMRLAAGGNLTGGPSDGAKGDSVD